MPNKKVKWLIYTVLIGLIPIFSRGLAWLITPSGGVNAFSASDVISFGLVLHISIINEIEHLDDGHTTWKTVQNGMSLIFIVLYTVLFTAALFSEGRATLVDQQVVKNCTIFLAIVSFFLGYAVLHRIAKIPPTRGP